MNWSKATKSTHTERRGLIKGAASIPNIEIVVRGRLGGMGSRWGYELTAAHGLSAKCLFIHETEEAAMLDAERVGLALQAVER